MISLQSEMMIIKKKAYPIEDRRTAMSDLESEIMGVRFRFADGCGIFKKILLSQLGLCEPCAAGRSNLKIDRSLRPSQKGGTGLAKTHI